MIIAMLAAAAPVIHVGDPAMSGRAIVPYDNVWLVTLHRIDGSIAERGLSTDHVRFIMVGGKRFLSRIESEADVIAPPGKPPESASSSTFNIFDPATMAPLHGEARSSDGDSMIREFKGRTVTTRTGASGESVMTAEPVFDMHGGMTGLLLTALPLKPGYRVRIPGIGDKGIDYTEISVVRRERVKAGRLGTVGAFVVDIGSGPSRSTYWISNHRPYVIRAIVRGPKGYASWDMIP